LIPLLVLDSTISLISTIIAGATAVSAIALGWLRWGREDQGSAASTAKTLIESMQAINEETRAQRDEARAERDALAAEVHDLEMRLEARGE
jgi:hypothetical protein